MTDSLRIALVEPYYGGSHQAWAEGYARHSVHDVEIFGLPAVFWKWRMQGGHVTITPQIEAAVAERGPFDLVLATSMTNVPALLGHARHVVGDIPTVLYMHENQLTYPLSPLDREDLTYAMVNWTSMAASELVVFNSQFHHDAWFDALPVFLGRFPDQRHSHLIDAVAARSIVLPVGVELLPFDDIARATAARPLVLWNQRWEFDKGPAEFAAAVTALADEGVAFDIALAGERYGEEPPEFTELKDALGHCIVHDGYSDVDDYRTLLRGADVVVSTAHQEFFGIAITEAIYAGAFPILPNRLVYPERIPGEHHERCLYDTDDELVAKLRWAIEHRAQAAEVTAALKPSMAACGWRVLAPRYDEVIAEVAG